MFCSEKKPSCKFLWISRREHEKKKKKDKRRKRKEKRKKNSNFRNVRLSLTFIRLIWRIPIYYCSYNLQWLLSHEVKYYDVMTAELAQLPHLKVFDRVLGLPVVELALAKSAETYSRVKDSNQLVHWALATAETSVNIATKQAVPIAVPIVKKFGTPLSFVDRTLCFGLDKIEEKVPLVKETPAQVWIRSLSLINQSFGRASLDPRRWDRTVILTPRYVFSDFGESSIYHFACKRSDHHASDESPGFQLVHRQPDTRHALRHCGCKGSG